jgi:A/G-specific adenine glycosylase
MLQQTRVEAVKPYFSRFIEALPDVQALALCPEERYLKLWEGLGYYNRVRNLHAAAQQIVAEYGGIIPDSYMELQKLPGIGSYTAGAIASIAYNHPVPAVDGNVLRVLSRVSADDSDIMKPAVKKEMERYLGELMERTDSGVVPRAFNQALMELGAMVCVPNGDPHCDVCPWETLCEAHRQGLTGELPVRSRAKARRVEEKTVFVIGDGERVALHKRPARGLLAGLYELPNCPGKLTAEEALRHLKGIGLRPLRIRPLTEAKHVFSHVEWHMCGYVVLVEEPDEVQGNLLFVEVQDAKEHYAVPSAFAAYWGAIVDET